jgi:hypothetical protein
VLEQRRADGSRGEVDPSVSLLRPDDTGTRRALREAVVSNAAVAFAVQLNWSVQPIDLAKVPPLAIFSAYTLYTVEGSREGRHWYGLRLGFFSDAISAKQVAHYVRSEFTSVAVVPVSPQERSRATATDRTTLVRPALAAQRVQDKLPNETSEFKLLDDAAAKPAAPASIPAAAPLEPTADAAHKPAATSARVSRQPPASVPSKRSARGAHGRVRAQDKRAPQTLEETLEILGADQLEIDDGRGETLNDSGVRHLKVEIRKNSPFTRLLDRLAERARRER